MISAAVLVLGVGLLTAVPADASPRYLDDSEATAVCAEAGGLSPADVSSSAPRILGTFGYEDDPMTGRFYWYELATGSGIYDCLAASYLEDQVLHPGSWEPAWTQVHDLTFTFRAWMGEAVVHERVVAHETIDDATRAVSSAIAVPRQAGMHLSVSATATMEVPVPRTTTVWVEPTAEEIAAAELQHASTVAAATQARASVVSSARARRDASVRTATSRRATALASASAVRKRAEAAAASAYRSSVVASKKAYQKAVRKKPSKAKVRVARKARSTRDARARRACDLAVGRARAQYRAAVSAADRARGATVASADRVLTAAIASADGVRDAAVAEADVVRASAVKAGPRSTYWWDTPRTRTLTRGTRERLS